MPLSALIRDEFHGETKELLLVRCRWAAVAARQARLPPLDSLLGDGGDGGAGGDALGTALGRICGSDDSMVEQWARLIAAVAAPRMAEVLRWSIPDGFQVAAEPGYRAGDA